MWGEGVVAPQAHAHRRDIARAGELCQADRRLQRDSISHGDRDEYRGVAEERNQVSHRGELEDIGGAGTCAGRLDAHKASLHADLGVPELLGAGWRGHSQQRTQEDPVSHCTLRDLGGWLRDQGGTPESGPPRET